MTLGYSVVVYVNITLFSTSQDKLNATCSYVEPVKLALLGFIGW